MGALAKGQRGLQALADAPTSPIAQRLIGGIHTGQWWPAIGTSDIRVVTPHPGPPLDPLLQGQSRKAMEQEETIEEKQQHHARDEDEDEERQGGM